MIDLAKTKSRTTDAGEVADLDTNEFAQILGVRPGTVRRSLCVNGHYMGIRPKTLPNGHHRWSGRKAHALVEV